MSAANHLHAPGEVQASDLRGAYEDSPVSGKRVRATARLDPLEEALVTRGRPGFSALEATVGDALQWFALGQPKLALQVAGQPLLEGRVPALTVSVDVLDELDLDHCAILVLARVDGMTELSRVLCDCGLPPTDAFRTVCQLVDRRLLVLRPRETIESETA